MATPLVFLPGMMCDARLFMPQVIALSSEIAVTVAPMTRGETVEAIARNILAQMPENFALAGLSMGGIVAMEMLRQAPNRIERLALMDTNCQGEMPSVAAAREPQIARVRAGRMVEVMRDEIKPQYLAPGSNHQEILQIVLDMAQHLGPDVFTQQSRALQRRPDQQATLRRAKTPTLVMCGEYDTLCPIRRHEFMAHLMPNAHLEVIADAGHLPTLERPDLVTDHLRQWLDAPATRPY